MKTPPSDRRSGQALIESCFVIAVLALVLFGLLEVTRLYAHREVLDHASAAGARAYAVGFNDFMVHKVVRAAAIPNAGAMTAPGYDRGAALTDAVRNDRVGGLWDLALRSQPVSPQYEVERSRIPLFLLAEDGGQLPAILDYERWDDIDHSLSEQIGSLVRFTTRQDVELRMPMHRAFYAGDEVSQESRTEHDLHFRLYLQ